ncbi:leucine rich repeat receptor-like protein kinase [Trichuris trichiura]|uniref:Leucine rich repeat receptor-like protein kinase n=1 Tax=Trichuris trichiura TaxID=36087 RepID=A0A077YYF5_TRITR|nr:leucine rich repeat receptor-like protein kinase [Trichuris trichiura]
MHIITVSVSLSIISAVVVPTIANYPQEEYQKSASYCDTETNTIVPNGEAEYYVCQKLPRAVGQQESSKGLWIRWTCNSDTEFDEEKCKPALDGPLFDPQFKSTMDESVFCMEILDYFTATVPSGPRCSTESSTLMPDEDNINYYYECHSENSFDRCGQWHLRTCDYGFDYYAQYCKGDEQQLLEPEFQMRQAYMAPYGPAPYAYAPRPAYGYGVPYAAPSVPVVPRTYSVAYVQPAPPPPQTQIALMPVMPATMGFPMSPMNPFMSPFAMQGMFQYFMSMFPWMFPGYGGFGMPPRGGAGGQRPSNPQQAPGGGGGGSPPQGGSSPPAGGGGGGIMGKLGGLASGGLGGLKNAAKALGPLAKLG